MNRSPIETVEEGVRQGYSSVLNLFIRWDRGQLGWSGAGRADHPSLSSSLQNPGSAEDHRDQHSDLG